ncbi:MAG: DEAD/DEAH box helicase [Bradyrhizobium sp.]
MPKDIAELAEQMLRDPARVAVTPVASTVERISQRILLVDHSAKPTLLAQLLKQEPVNRALIFTRTKHGADKVVKGLARAGITADAIHGNKSQNHRERVLDCVPFRRDPHPGRHRHCRPRHRRRRHQPCGEFRPSQHPETYVHRIGRTARAGAEGVAISLVASGDEMTYLRDIEKLIRIALREKTAAHPVIATQPRRRPRSQRAPCATLAWIAHK